MIRVGNKAYIKPSDSVKWGGHVGVVISIDEWMIRPYQIQFPNGKIRRFSAQQIESQESPDAKS